MTIKEVPIEELLVFLYLLYVMSNALYIYFMKYATYHRLLNTHYTNILVQLKDTGYHSNGNI